MTDDLEQAVEAAAADPSETRLAEVAHLWTLEQARRLVEAERLRQRQAALVAEARQHVDALRRSEREAHQRLREAITAHEEVLVHHRHLVNRPGAPSPEAITTAAEAEASVVRLGASRRNAAAAHAKAVAVLQRAAAEVERIEGDGAAQRP